MRVMSYRRDGRAGWGLAVGEGEAAGVVELAPRVGDRWPDLATALAAQALPELERFAGLAPDLPLDAVVFEPPVPRPPKILCVGVNYRDRNEEYRDGAEAPRYPSLFMRSSWSFTGHGQPLVRPPESVQLDYEGEIAIVIGRGGRRIPAKRAREHVAGLTVLNEGTIRDWLRHGKFNVTQGKNFDRTGSIGPWLVTTDALPAFDALRVITRVNGEVRQDDSTDRLMFPFEFLIEYVSTFATLEPGDVISTGTPTGAGARFDPPKWLAPGDVVEVEVPGIGVLRNGIVDEVTP